MRKPLPSRTAVLELLAGQDRALDAREVAERLGVAPASQNGLLRMLDDLVFDGVVTARGDKFKLGAAEKTPEKAAPPAGTRISSLGSSGPSAVTGYAKRANGPASTSHRGGAGGGGAGGGGAGGGGDKDRREHGTKPKPRGFTLRKPSRRSRSLRPPLCLGARFTGSAATWNFGISRSLSRLPARLRWARSSSA